eukprot:IDg18331t1
MCAANRSQPDLVARIGCNRAQKAVSDREVDYSQVGGDIAKLPKRLLVDLEKKQLDLATIQKWSQPADDEARKDEIYDSIREIERQNGLAYLKKPIVRFFESLMAICGHTVRVLYDSSHQI